MPLIEFTVDDISFLRDLLDFLDLKKASYTVLNTEKVGSVFKVQILKCSELDELKTKLVNQYSLEIH